MTPPATTPAAPEECPTCGQLIRSHAAKARNAAAAKPAEEAAPRDPPPFLLCPVCGKACRGAGGLASHVKACERRRAKAAAGEGAPAVVASICEARATPATDPAEGGETVEGRAPATAETAEE